MKIVEVNIGLNLNLNSNCIWTGTDTYNKANEGREVDWGHT